MVTACILILLLCITYQDLKYRSVHIGIFVLLAGAVFVHNYRNGLLIRMPDLPLNLIFVMLLTAVIWLYFRLRFKSWNLFGLGLGAGDLVLWLIMAFYFSFVHFIIWFNATLFLSLLLHMLLKRKGWYGKENNIPLAGIQSFFSAGSIAIVNGSI